MERYFALLKILEEPPSHVVFLLTCDNRAQLLPTVQSRSVCIPLGGVPEEEALPLLRQRLPDAGEEELKRAQGELQYLKVLDEEIRQGALMDKAVDWVYDHAKVKFSYKISK